MATPSAKNGALTSPTTTQIRRKRRRAKLTQTDAGRLVHVSMRTWQDWENGRRKMSLSAWELFNLLIDFPAVRNARARWYDGR